MLLLIKYTLLYGIVLMLVALGGMFSEHSGVINIALEGIMVVGGLAGVLVTASLPTTMAPGAHRFGCRCGSSGLRHALLAAAGVCFHQLKSRPDHRRHGAKHAGNRHCHDSGQAL